LPHGHTPKVPIGTVFPDRRALGASGVHPPFQAGIYGYSGGQPAESIVLSEGYVDDVDSGDEIIYTGQGGRDPESGRQVADQSFDRGNIGLARCCEQGIPVRVTRRVPNGYRYDGLYQVESYWHETGRDGFRIYRFKLVAEDRSRDGSHTPNSPGNASPRRVEQSTLRVVRESAVARQVKLLHRYACQVCGETLGVPGGLYAEAAHIRPLGRPHNGPDTMDNILCLCPNHHVLLDRGSITVDSQNIVQPLGTPLRAIQVHVVGQQNTDYHRTRIYKI
jgi:putative restriction endonuclease